MLKEAGIDIDSMSDSSSAMDSDFEEEAEKIEINQKIQEMRRVCSIATLVPEKMMILSGLGDYAKEIGAKNSIEHIVCFIIPEILKKEKDDFKVELINAITPLAKFLVSTKEGYNAVLRDILKHFSELLCDIN